MERNYTACTEEELIRRFRAGEKEIMDFILEKYKPMVRQKAKAMYLLGGENDDLMQEGMIGLFRAVQDFREDSGMSFGGFASLCISRQLYTAVRAASRKKHTPLNYYVSIYGEPSEEGEKETLPLSETIESDRPSDPEELFFSRENAENFEEELEKRLSRLESRVLYLHMLGMDYLTVAELMDKSPKSVDNALQRIRAKAKELLKEMSS